jgi:hypothetical protein
MEFEEWLHKYRKLYRDDPIRFASESTNYTDSRLKFKRNFIFIMKKLYLLNKDDELLMIMEHLIQTNTNKNWDII